MLKQRYEQAASVLHADEELIERTLHAAARSRAKTVSISPGGRRLIVGFVCTLVVLMALMPRLMLPHQDILTTSEELPASTGDLLPLPSDELTLSVSEVELVSDTQLSLILTVQGDKVDPLTTIDFDYTDINGNRPGVSHVHFGQADEYEGQPSNERCFNILFESKGRHILEVLGPTLNLDISRYTSGNQKSQPIHEIDWNAVDFTFQEEGEPIIDLGNGFSFSGFWFTDEGLLTVQSRWPSASLDPTYIIIWLSPDGTNDDRTNIYLQKSTQYVAGDSIYSNYTFPVTRDELDGMSLVTYIILAGEEVLGNWPISVDLSHLSVE